MTTLNLSQPIALGPQTDTLVLWSIDIDFVNKTVNIRYAPPNADGSADFSSTHVQVETLRNARVPAEPEPLDTLPELPEFPDEDAEASEKQAYRELAAKRDADMVGHLRMKKERSEVAAERLDALQNQWFDQWVADPRPEVTKAHDFFLRRRGLAAKE
jgi:hypothetical protein